MSKVEKFLLMVVMLNGLYFLEGDTPEQKAIPFILIIVCSVAFWAIGEEE